MKNGQSKRHTTHRMKTKKSKIKQKQTKQTNKHTQKKQHTHRANDEQQGPPNNEHRCL